MKEEEMKETKERPPEQSCANCAYTIYEYHDGCRCLISDKEGGKEEIGWCADWHEMPF